MGAALEGIRVLELGGGKALAYAGKLLRDLGAEVIKVEPPEGDLLRGYGPFPGDEPNPEQSGLFIYLNAGKRGLCLDPQSEERRPVLDALLDDADVLLHSLRPRSLRQRHGRPRLAERPARSVHWVAASCVGRTAQLSR